MYATDVDMILSRLASRSSCARYAADVDTFLLAACMDETSCVFICATDVNVLLPRFASRSSYVIYATDMNALLLAVSIKNVAKCPLSTVAKISGQRWLNNERPAAKRSCKGSTAYSS